MGKRGPPKKPTAILKARGSWRADERADAEMPEGIPEAPAWLQGAGRVHWYHLMPMLCAARVVRQTDGPALARYCALWGRWRQAEEWLDRHGTHHEKSVQVRDENGIPQLDAQGQVVLHILEVEEWPQVKRAIRLAESLTRLEDRFGLNPSARASVGGDPKKQADTGKSRFFGA